MPNRTPDIVVVSPRSLVRELLVALLRARGAGRVAACATGPEALSLATANTLFVWDAGGSTAAADAAFRESLQRLNPGARVARVDDTSAAAELETIAELWPGARHEPLPHTALTPLESEVMLAVAIGFKNVDIAQRMKRSAKTIEKHRANAMRKLGVRSVAQLTAYTIRHRLLDGEAILSARSR